MELNSLPGISQHLSSKSTSLPISCKLPLVPWPDGIARLLDSRPCFFYALKFFFLHLSCVLICLCFSQWNYRSSGETAHVVMDPVLLELLWWSLLPHLSAPPSVHSIATLQPGSWLKWAFIPIHLTGRLGKEGEFLCQGSNFLMPRRQIWLSPSERPVSYDIKAAILCPCTV